MGKTHRRTHNNAQARETSHKAADIDIDIKPDYELDGRTLEGGGQLLRVALCLSALTKKSIRITNIRGNRSGQRGLKNQHLACVRTLASACDALTVGAHVGSQDLLFTPGQGRDGASDNATMSLALDEGTVEAEHLKVDLPTPGAITLVMQAVIPYLLFKPTNRSTLLSISGATHTTSSPSIDYVDAVLIPNLMTFGLPLGCIHRMPLCAYERTLNSFGKVDYLIHPVAASRLSLRPALPNSRGRLAIRAYVLFQSIQDRAAYCSAIIDGLADGLISSAASVLDTHQPPDATVAAVGTSSVEEHRIERAQTTEARSASTPIHGSHTIYILLVATTANGTSCATDFRHTITPKSSRKSSASSLEQAFALAATAAAAKLGETLKSCQRRGSDLDEHMRDQIIVFLGVLGGRITHAEPQYAATSPENASSSAVAVGKDALEAPDKHGLSLHAQTAIVVAETILGVKYNADGAGVEHGWLLRPDSSQTGPVSNDEDVIADKLESAGIT